MEPMHEGNRIFRASWDEVHASVDMDGDGLPAPVLYKCLHEESIAMPAEFLSRMGLHWNRRRQDGEHSGWSFDPNKGSAFRHSFHGGETSIAWNALDRHISRGLGGSLALLWQGREDGNVAALSFQELHDATVAMTRWLRERSVGQGMRVAAVLPPLPTALPLLLACGRVGAVHLTLPPQLDGGALARHLTACKAKVVATAADATVLHTVMDATRAVSHEMVGLVLGGKAPETRAGMLGLDWLDDAMLLHNSRHLDDERASHNSSWIAAEDTAFLLHSTPRGGDELLLLAHSVGSFMVNAFLAASHTMQLRAGDRIFCGADLHTIAGHTLGTYGPLLAGACVVMQEGGWADPSRLQKLLQDHRITHLYLTAEQLAELESAGSAEELLGSAGVQLRHVAVGEPASARSWQWLCAQAREASWTVSRQWWLPEAGGCVAVGLPDSQGGTRTVPTLGVELALLDEHGREVPGQGEGRLCLRHSWDSLPQGLRRWDERGQHLLPGFQQGVGGCFSTGCLAKRDEQGPSWQERVGGRIGCRSVVLLGGDMVDAGGRDATLDS